MQIVYVMSGMSAMSAVSVPRNMSYIGAYLQCLLCICCLKGDVPEAKFIISTGLMCLYGYALQTMYSVLESGYVISVCNV